MEIVAILDENGVEQKWAGQLVSRFEAMQRRRRNEPIVERVGLPDRKFKFSLGGGEHVVVQDEQGNSRILRVVVISEGQVEFVEHADARPITLRKKTRGARIRMAPEALRKANASKAAITPLGDIVSASD
jgi:hypothetical protein